jgi:hypothetical protein
MVMNPTMKRLEKMQFILFLLNSGLTIQQRLDIHGVLIMILNQNATDGRIVAIQLLVELYLKLQIQDLKYFDDGTYCGGYINA